jgi:DNA (cytosine-5)-methyltransferase 1
MTSGPQPDRRGEKLRVLDLFSGIGGFSLGLERTGGFETVAFCEINPFPRAVLAKHWPEVPCFDDIRTLTADALCERGIAVDVICGGFPCQDISLAGKGAGIEGERSGLWSEYARLIGELRPRYVLVENVAALLSRGLDRVLGDLAALGYDAEWHCIPASAVGLYHDRDRLWIVAHPAGQHGDARCLLEASGERRALLQSRRLHSDALAAVGRLPGKRLQREPRLARLVQRVPDRTHRLEAQGNTVVPQIPELIGRAILASLDAEREAA